jgi:hypothetical protein
LGRENRIGHCPNGKKERQGYFEMDEDGSPPESSNPSDVKMPYWYHHCLIAGLRYK